MPLIKIGTPFSSNRPTPSTVVELNVLNPVRIPPRVVVALLAVGSGVKVQLIQYNVGDVKDHAEGGIAGATLIATPAEALLVATLPDHTGGAGSPCARANVQLHATVPAAGTSLDSVAVTSAVRVLVTTVNASSCCGGACVCMATTAATSTKPPIMKNG